MCNRRNADRGRRQVSRIQTFRTISIVEMGELEPLDHLHIVQVVRLIRNFGRWERGYCKTNFHKRVLLGLAAKTKAPTSLKESGVFDGGDGGLEPPTPYIRNDSGTKRRSTKKVPKTRKTS